MTTTTDPLAAARTLIRAWQHDEPGNGATPADCGDFCEVMEEAARAFAQGGAAAAMKVIATEPELLRLAAGDEVETPPAVREVEPFLETKDILDALRRGELGDAELLARLYHDRLAYDHAEKRWYLWGGQHWTADETGQVTNLLADKVASQYLHAAALKRQADDEQARAASAELQKRAAALRHRRRVGNVLTLAASQPALALTGREWDAAPMRLAAANGIIELDTGNFRPGRPGDYIRTAAPVAWRGLNAPAPRWERFLQEIFAGDDELIAFVQRLLGYGITGQAIEHVLPVLWGKGRNGKETLLETLRAVLGDLAAPASKDVVMEARRDAGAATPHLYDLRHRRLVWVSETREGARLNAEQVKWLTGGGTITARPLHGHPVTFTPRYLLLLITNHRPKADPDDYALWKRLLLIPFTQSFVDDPQAADEHKADPRLPEKLRAEGPGILAWLVRGCLDWQAEGLKPPATVRLATEKYRQEEDELAQFVGECCFTGAGAEATGGELYKAYRDWCDDYGLKAMSATAFGRKMSRRFEKRRAGRGMIYAGVGLLAGQEEAKTAGSV